MIGCDCPHSVAEHGTAELFETQMCLAPDCDCQGTTAELRTLAGQRNAEMNRLVSVIREVLGSRLPRSIDDQARNVASALLVTYKMEER